MWPMPHQAADSIPWVQVTLASGETVQTKLLVSLIPSHAVIAVVHLSLSFLGFYFTLTFIFLICFSDWCRWTKLYGEAGIGDTHGQVELRPICCGCCAAPIRGEYPIQHMHTGSFLILYYNVCCASLPTYCIYNMDMHY